MIRFDLAMLRSMTDCTIDGVGVVSVQTMLRCLYPEGLNEVPVLKEFAVLAAMGELHYEAVCYLVPGFSDTNPDHLSKAVFTAKRAGVRWVVVGEPWFSEPVIGQIKRS